jgi:N utilization substance protein B
VENNLEKIDEIIEKSLVNYSLSRLNKVDKAIIRLATAEMLDGKTPKKVIINEALEITKEYSDQGDHKATSFNNRLLENISKNL